MKDKYILFYITDDNIFNSYFLKLVKKFDTNFIITNISKNIQIDKLDKLTLLKLSARIDDLFFLEFFGKDAELAFILIFSYFNTKSKIISSNKNLTINHQIIYNDRSNFCCYQYDHVYMDKITPYSNNHKFKIKDNILNQIAQQVCISNKTIILKTLYQREKFSSTQLNQHIAIPHILSDLVKKPMIIIKNIDNAIRWSCLDETVQLVISIILPKTISKQLFEKFKFFFIWLNNPENQNILFKMRKDKKIIFLINFILNKQ